MWFRRLRTAPATAPMCLLSRGGLGFGRRTALLHRPCATDRRVGAPYEEGGTGQPNTHAGMHVRARTHGHTHARTGQGKLKT